MSDDTPDDTADTMRERVDENRLKLWLLMRANRLVVAGVLVAVVFVAFVPVVAALPPPFARQIESGDAIETLFASMITVVVTGTTLVVTIGELVLTQELGPLGDQRERMTDSLAVRESVAELTGSPAPTDPSALLDELLGVAAERSRTLRASVDGPDDEFRREVEEFAADVVGNADAVRDPLEDAQFGSFDVLFAALNFNYSRKLFRVERLTSAYGDRLDERERDLLHDIRTALSLFGSVREHVKTLYFQWALIDLSRLILYAAIPAVIVAGVMLAVVNAGTFPGRTLGVDHIVLVVGGAFAVTLAPFMLFVSYVLRILTVAKRTLAIEPLVLRDSRR